MAKLARISRFSSVSVVSALLIAAASCSTKEEEPAKPNVPLAPGSPWPKFRANAAQDGASAVHPKTSGGALWAFPTGKGIFSSPVVGADGTIYIGSADRSFYALNADGTLRWKVDTGEIIDSSALLDDRGRVYFGSGDGKLRALDANTGAPVWTFDADPPSTNKAFINWFEGNVAIGPTGTLYVPNDNFFVYAIDRDSGGVSWRFRMPDQTWSSPAVDAESGLLFVGNNNLLPLLGQNTFAIAKNGESEWGAISRGSIAASPMITPDHKVILGGFDGYLRAYDPKYGEQIWERATRDHLYASPARLPDGTIVQPSADGTIYGVGEVDGAVKWAFDTREPIRSSPAVDAEGNIYVGSGEGRLFVLRKDGTLGWSMRLIEGDRNDLNASPALGNEAIYIAGESGEIFSVPYEYCLRPEAASDGRCRTSGGEDLPSDGAALLFTTRFGALASEPPAEIEPNQPLVFSLSVRAASDSKLAILDSASLAVTVEPKAEVDTAVSGDGKFVTVTPKTGFLAGPDGAVTIHVKSSYLIDLERAGLRVSGGTRGGEAELTMRPKVRVAVAGALPLPVPLTPGDRAAIWEVSRLAVPIPTLMPSYNQIGFDSLHYLVGMIEEKDGRGVAWMAGARRREGESATTIDPATKALFPLAVAREGGVMTLSNEDGLSVEVMNLSLPFKSFRIATTVGSDGSAKEAASLTGATVCATVPTYGPFLQVLGLCNPQTDLITVFGGAKFEKLGTGIQTAPSGLGAVTFALEAKGLAANIADSKLLASEHVVSLLLVDDASGKPVTLGYGLETTRTVGPNGEGTRVAVPFGARELPANVRAYLVVDTYPAARETIALPR